MAPGVLVAQIPRARRGAAVSFRWQKPTSC